MKPQKEAGTTAKLSGKFNEIIKQHTHKIVELKAATKIFFIDMKGIQELIEVEMETPQIFELETRGKLLEFDFKRES